jgi:disulfide bond formation protein DsbB
LLAAAYGSEHLGGLSPCEMCYWQRYAHFAGLGFALASLAMLRAADLGRSLVWLAALGILASGLIGAYHAGVELGWFEGLTQCSATGGGASREERLRDIMSTPLVRCDEVQWQFLGISMAGWNAIISLSSALVILWLSLRRPRIRP